MIENNVNMVKERIITYISSVIKKFDSSDFDIDTNEGKVINIREDSRFGTSVTIDKSIKNGSTILNYCELKNLSVTTLYQIVEHLKCELQYIEVVEHLKKKKNHWDKDKREWTHKPIDKDMLMEKIRFHIRRGKVRRPIARRSNNKA